MTGRRHKVVVVDDTDVQAELFREYLSGKGYEVYVASTGAQALQMVRDLRPDIVLLDLMLPDMSGSDVCAQLRADMRTQAIPVILCTANAITPEEKVKGFRQGADDYLVRPFELAELCARIEAVLRRSTLQPKYDTLEGIQKIVSKSASPALPSVPAPTPVPLQASIPVAVSVSPPAAPASPKAPGLSLLKHIWGILNFPGKTLKMMSERDELLVAIFMVLGTPAVNSVSKLFAPGSQFDAWIGTFALGLVVHLVLWFATAFILQMALPFLGYHLSMKRALGLAGIAWTPRFLQAVLSGVYSGVASVSLAGQASRFTAYGVFDLWAAWIIVVAIWVETPLARPRWNSATIIAGVSCFVTGVLSRF